MDHSEESVVAACADLSESLWRTRELLESLSYRIEVQRALVETGRSSWLARSTRDVDELITTVRSAELTRAVDLVPLTELLGVAPEATLREIADVVPAPWDQVLAEHRHALSELTGRLTEAALANKELLASSAQAIDEALARFRGSATGSTYTATGTRDRESASRFFDETT